MNYLLIISIITHKIRSYSGFWKYFISCVSYFLFVVLENIRCGDFKALFASQNSNYFLSYGHRNLTVGIASDVIALSIYNSIGCNCALNSCWQPEG